MDTVVAVTGYLEEQQRWRDLLTMCDHIVVWWIDTPPDELLDRYIHALDAIDDLEETKRLNAQGVAAISLLWPGRDLDTVLERAMPVVATASDGAGLWAAYTMAIIYSRTGDREAALDAARQGHALAASANPEERALATGLLAVAVRDMDDAKQAQQLADEALALLDGAPDNYWTRAALLNVSNVLQWPHRDHPAFEAALPVVERLQGRPGLSPRFGSWCSIAHAAAFLETEPPKATGHLVQALQLADRHHITNAISVAARGLAVVAAAIARPDVAAQLAGYASALPSDVAFSPYGPWLDGLVAAATQDLPETERQRHFNIGRGYTRHEFLHVVNDLHQAAAV